MASYSGIIRGGVGYAGQTWGWMDLLLCKTLGWSTVAQGTLNVQLTEYADYTINRSVDFLIPHTAAPQAPWDCYFQHCTIEGNGKTHDAIIATTGHNHWGKERTIEIKAPVNLRATLGLGAGSEVTVSILLKGKSGRPRPKNKTPPTLLFGPMGGA